MMMRKPTVTTTTAATARRTQMIAATVLMMAAKNAFIAHTSNMCADDDYDCATVTVLITMRMHSLVARS